MNFFKNILNYLRHYDWVLFGVVLLLVSAGITTLYGIALASETPDFSNFRKQILFTLLGFVLMFAVSSFNYKILYSYARHIYIASLVILLLVLFFGRTVRGTTGWFTFAGYNFQAVELAKIALIIILAWFFDKNARQMDQIKNVAKGVLYTCGLMLLVLLQPDFGSALVLLFSWLLMTLTIGISRRHFIILLIAFMTITTTFWFLVLKDYQKDRILSFIDPARDPLGRGYNITQATIAVGSGKFLGRGLGFGSQSQLKFLPESQTDFIFAVMAEEFGFSGVAVILLLFFIFFWRLFSALKRCASDFGTFLLLGIMAVFFIHVMINVGMNIGLAPVTGISLPFLSYGGSFLAVSFFLVGLAQSVIIRNN